MKKVEVLSLAFAFLMSKNIFKFKQFEIIQEKSAMKIGTDGVLLGAWAEIENPKNILDIGSGTGLISLMMAQRFPQAKIKAIEIEKNAFEESKINFEYSPFAERCKVQHTSLQKFTTEEKFDLIVSNPPFFELTHKIDSNRNLARQQLNLSFDELLFHAESLMDIKGSIACIIPYSNEKTFLSIAENSNLFPEKITRVKGNKEVEFKRSLIQLKKEKTRTIIDQLIIEKERNIYTSAYIDLTKDFYLKM